MTWPKYAKVIPKCEFPSGEVSNNGLRTSFQGFETFEILQALENVEIHARFDVTDLDSLLGLHTTWWLPEGRGGTAQRPSDLAAWLALGSVPETPMPKGPRGQKDN